MNYHKYSADNCPKCDYPTGYKGVYTSGYKCGGCGYLEIDEEIVNLNKQLDDNIKQRTELARTLRIAIARKYETNR